jgi:hypothetical protein
MESLMGSSRAWDDRIRGHFLQAWGEPIAQTALEKFGDI